jgi:hypothetical protein
MDRVYQSSLGAIFQNTRSREPFDAGLRKLFAISEGRPSERIEQLLERLVDADSKDP